MTLTSRELSRLRAEWAELKARSDAEELRSPGDRARLAELEQLPGLRDYVESQNAAVAGMLGGPSPDELAGSELFVERVMVKCKQLLPPRLRVVEDGADAAESEWTMPRAGGRFFRPALMAAVVAGGALAATWALWPQDVPVEAELPQLAKLTYSSGVASVAPHLEQGGVMVTDAGQACVEPAPGVDVCLGAHGHVRFEQLTANRHILRLLRGDIAVALDDRPRDLELSVVAGDTWATATGTVFAVSASGEEARVAVLRGTVEVKQGEAGAEPVTGDYTMRSSAGTKLELLESTPAEQVAAWRLLQPTNLWRRTALPNSTRLSQLLVHAPEAVEVRIDGVDLGTTPVSVSVAPGMHRIAVVGPQSEPLEVREVELASGATASVRFDSVTPVEEPAGAPASSATSSSATATAKAKVAAKEPSTVTAKELLANARHDASAGAWAAAAAKYRQLRRSFPKSAEAHTVLVALGDIERLRLGNNAAALRAYSAYLRSGGALAQEARSGKARALRALGRTAEERAALSDYLRAHPKGVEARAFRKRLQSLE